MVKILVGDLFESQAQTLVNTVNTVGVMGKGVALGFKQRFPAMYKDYLARCRADQVVLGKPYLYRDLMGPWILNFPTKGHWRAVARLSDIVDGLNHLEANYESWGITSLAVPPLGCGEGQLEWKVVGRTLYNHLRRLSIPSELYAPYGTTENELAHEFLSSPIGSNTGATPRVEPGIVALVEILSQLEREPYHWPTGRVLFQKVAYFATEEGIATGLTFERSSYGPFASGMKRLVTKLVNNGLIQEEKLGRMFAVKVGPTFADAQLEYEEAIARWRPAVEKIVDLFLRMRTSDAELAATVHFAARTMAETSAHSPTEIEVLKEVQEWKRRRTPAFNQGEIASTIRHLAALGWLNARPSPSLPVSAEALQGP